MFLVWRSASPRKSLTFLSSSPDATDPGDRRPFEETGGTGVWLSVTVSFSYSARPFTPGSFLMLAAVLALVVSAAPSSPELSPEDAAKFKALFTQGESLYSEGDLGAAIWNFKQADQLRQTPEVAYDLAKAYQKLGDEAYTAYYFRLYMRRAPNAPDALEVAELLGDMLERAEATGRGLLEVEAAEEGSVVVQGKRYEELPVAAFLAPGDYEVSAQLRSGAALRTVSIRTGKTTTVALSAAPPLVTAEPPSSPPPAVAGLGVSRGLQLPSRETLHTASVVSGAVGLTALVVGMALGSMSSSDVGRYRREHNELTLTQAQALASAANGKGTAANVLLIGGGLLTAGSGAAFYFTLPEPGGK